MRDPRLTKLAEVLVNYSVGVKPGQLVRLSGPPVAQPLILELYRETVKAGGNPMVRMAPEELAEILLKNGADEQLRFVNPITLHEYETIDCSIGIWAEENTKGAIECGYEKAGADPGGAAAAHGDFYAPCGQREFALERNAVSVSGRRPGCGDEPGGI